MKAINTSVLLVVLSLLPFLFSSCSEDESSSAPLPTVSIEAGEVTDNSLSFTVTAENATKAAYVCIKKGEILPTIENILKGTSIKAGKATAVTVPNLEHNTEYVIAVAVEGEGGTATKTQTMKTAKTPDLTIALTLEGEATETSFSFKITVENATKCAYKYIKEGDAVPTATTILADGTKITDFTKVIELKELLSNTKYEVYAAVEGKVGSVLSEPLKVTTKETIHKFTVAGRKTSSGNNFYMSFSNDTYELLMDAYTTSGAKYLMPGKYTLAGMKEMEFAKQYSQLKTLATDANQKFTEGEMVVAIVEGNTYEINFSLTLENGETIKAYYKGEIAGVTVVEEKPEDTYTFVIDKAKRQSIDGAISGEYYIKVNNNAWDFEMALDFYAAASTTELPAGTYTLNSTKDTGTLGTDSYINVDTPADKKKFKTNFDGTSSGTVKVEKTANIYTLTIDLVNSTGLKYKGTFTGEITNMDLAN